MNLLATLDLALVLAGGLWDAWSPLLLTLATIYTVAFFGTKMYRQARANAAVRAERRARAAYRAEVIDINHLLPTHSHHGNIA